MKAAKIIAPKESGFGRQLRAVRSNAVVEDLNLFIEVKQQKLKVINISESGAAVRGDIGDVVYDSIPIKVLINNTKEIYSGNAKCVWKHSAGGETMCGFSFSSGFLEKDLIRNIEKVSFLYQQVVKTDADFQEIPDNFKVFVTNFRVYLVNLKKSLDELDEDLLVHSPETKASCEKAIALTIEEQILKKLGAYNLELNGFLEALKDRVARTRAVEYFRVEVGHLLTSSPFTRRALKKPLGYAGDYETMNQIYRNAYEGVGLFNKIVHKYSVNEFSSRSVRFRRKFFKDAIVKGMEGRQNYTVASIACGPATEIADLATSISEEDARKLNLVLLDQDVEALLSAKRTITEISLERRLSLQVEYIPVAVKEILEGSSVTTKIANSFDFIYTAGLFDYLTQSTAKIFAHILLDCLKPGGRLLIGNFHPRNPTKAISEFAVDWRLIHRNEQEMSDLIPDNLTQSKKIFLDEEEIEVFLDIIK